MSQSVAIEGILDIKGDHGFVRVRDYAPSEGDIFVPPNLIRRYRLRRGDTITGTAAAVAGAKQKFRPLLELEAPPPPRTAQISTS